MPFPTIDPSVDEYTNPITGASYMRGPNNVWTQVDQFNKVDVDVLKEAFDAQYVNLTGDDMTGPLSLKYTGDDTDSFQILGRQPGSDNSVTDEVILTTYHNVGTTGSAVNYYGLIENPQNIANKKYVDDAITAADSIAGFLKKDGDTMSGTITFDGTNSRISAGTVTNLSDRCSLLLTTAGDRPVGIASSSETSKILSLYRYNDTADDNREEIATFQANGYTRLGGKLRVQPKLLADGDIAFEIKDDTEARIYMRKNGNVNFMSTATSGSVFAITPESASVRAFGVDYDGAVSAGNTTDPFMAAQPQDLITKGYLDSKNLVETPTLDAYLRKSGGTMSGQLTLDRGAGSTLVMASESGADRWKIWNTNGESRMEIFSGQTFKITGTVSGNLTQLFGVSGSGNVTLNNLRDPSGSKDAANKRYVDALAKRTCQRWKYASHEVAANLAEGEFFIASSNGHIYMHPRSYDNINMGVNSSAGTVTLNFLCTVHDPATGANWYNIVADEIKFNNGDSSGNKYIRIKKSSELLVKSNITAGNVYLINIPGFTL